jgi:hypothetical protein
MNSPHSQLLMQSFFYLLNQQKLEFNTATGTALYPYLFSLNYEFVDTEMGGDLVKFDENNEEDRKMEGEFALCSRTFKNRRGEFRSPRNVFLHGRGGAKNLSCLYRFEANAGEQVQIIFASIFHLIFLPESEESDF